MNDLPRQKLCALVNNYGEDIYQDKKRCRAFLADYCGEYQREIFVLIKAIDQKVPVELKKHQQNPKVPLRALITCLKNRLQNSYALTEGAALWAVKSWASALAVISQATFSSQQLMTTTNQTTDGEGLYELENILLFSVLVGKVNLVKSLIQAGVNLDVQDNKGRTPLIYSILANHQQVAKELVRAEANLEIIDSTGYSALHWAIMLGEYDLVDLLLQAGADIGQPNKSDNRARKIAVNYGQPEIKKLINQVEERR